MYPSAFDTLSKPSPSTIRSSTGGISPANTVSSIIQSQAYIEYRLGLAPAAVTFTADSGTDLLTSAGHGLADNDIVHVTTTGVLPGGLAADTPYFVVTSTTNTFQLAATRGGSAIDLTSAGSGTHSFTQLLSESKLLVSTSGSRSQWSNAISLASGSLILPQSSSIAPTAEGSIGWDTDDNLAKIGTGSGTKTLFDTDSTQTATNKTFTGPTITNPSVTGTVSGGATYSSPVLTTPTIASFTNAQHDHSNAAGGGKLTSTGITSLDLSLTTLSNPYKFHVMRVNAANTTGASFAKLTFDTETFDTNNNFSGGTYTVPVAGFYQFNAKVNASSPGQLVIALYKNGSIVRRGGHDNNGAGIASAVFADLVQCAASDTMEIYVFADNTVAYEVSSTVGPFFSGFLVSTT